MRASAICKGILAATLCAGPLCAGDAIKPADLPEAVRAALDRKFPHATVTAAERDDHRNDYVVYVVTLRDGKDERRVALFENGDIAPK